MATGAFEDVFALWDTASSDAVGARERAQQLRSRVLMTSAFAEAGAHLARHAP